MARDRDRARRDLAGVGPDPDQRRRNLVSMDDLKGYTFADGEPDIRGWDVRTLNGREVGEVEDLLIDPDRGEVVMLEVEMRDGGVHAELPIRSVQLDRESRAVIVDSGDIDSRHDVRARDRIGDDDRAAIRDRYRGDDERQVRYGAHDHDHDRSRDHDIGDSDRIVRDGVEETVVERRPVIEEVVVRRRVVEE